MISIDDVEHVAKLARLALSEDEKAKFAKQLGNILEYVKQLEEVNTKDIEPMAQAIPKVNVMREDKVWSPCDREKILENAPQEENGYFKVPKIIED